MKTLALRIYLTVVAVLLIFALITGWLAQHNLEHERTLVQTLDRACRCLGRVAGKQPATRHGARRAASPGLSGLG